MGEKIHCQSCSRPINGDSDFGTEADGKRSIEYCSCCYQRGTFTEPDVTMDEMIARVTDIVIEHKIMSPEVVHEQIPALIGRLKRWSI